MGAGYIPVSERNRDKLEWCSDKLRNIIEEHKISVFKVRDTGDLTFGFMAAAYDADTGIQMILVCVDDIRGAGITRAEAEAMLWHEVAHIVYGATEIEADDFAVDHTSYDVWKSSIRKVYRFFDMKPEEGFMHRAEVLE